jgi:DNA-directed RNA polymerase subunit RPC12/RpoP
VLNEPLLPVSTVLPGRPGFPSLSDTDGVPGSQRANDRIGTPPWAGLAAMAAASGRQMAPMEGRRFAALSSLPEALRLPPKRDTPPARHQRPAAPPSPQPGSEIPAQPVLPPPSRQLPASSAQQLGFNCPSCFTVLIIKEPATYDGRAAPCPTCGIRILPPQRVPDSPFSIVHRSDGFPQLAGQAPRPGRMPPQTVKALTDGGR